MKKYLNIQTLRQTTEFIDERTTIIDSDKKVSNWFTPCPDGFKGKWINGKYTFVKVGKPAQKVLDKIKADKESALAKKEIESQIKTMIVTTASKKTFHADDQARLNMMAGVMSAEFANITEATWRLYDKDEAGANIETIVTLNELKEAIYLALKKFGTLKSIGA